MKNLQIEESKAKSLYKTAAPEFKSMLEDTFGKKFFIENITDVIKDFKDACQYFNIKNHRDAYKLLGMRRNHMCEVLIDECEDTYLRLCIYTLALNEGKSVNIRTEVGYFPYFDHTKKVGSGFCASTYRSWPAGSSDSSRLALRTSSLALYSGQKFEQEYYDYMYN